MPARAARATPLKAPPPAASEALQRYRDKRDFGITAEPSGHAADTPGAAPSFVVQEHHARSLHYDFRLELGGVLLSWAVPKGPSLDPADKRMAVRTEDHPLAYAGFEGRIPERQYGAGEVIVWDRGAWQAHGDPQAGLAAGKLGFTLHGHKLRGRWELVRMRKPDEKRENWLLFKQRDAEARPRAEFDVLTARPGSVLKAGAAEPVAVPDIAAAPVAPAAPAPPAGQALPATISPQLAVAAAALPAEGRWVFEDKFDGYRMLARIDAGGPRLFTRNGHDWTHRLPHLVGALAALGVGSAWLDGEVVAPGADGRPDFNRLQNAFDAARTQDLAFMLFDVPWFEGQDLRQAPLASRRELLRGLLAARGRPALQFSAALGSGGAAMAERLLRQACAAQREGLLAKREDSPYTGSRSTAWLKLKCRLRQEFVLAGYSVRADDPQAVGSLLLALHDATGKLQAAGSVGTGWTAAAAKGLLQKLRPLRTAASPLAGPPAAKPGQWLRPEQLAEVSFAAWTPAGHVRHAVFVGLRSDKPASAVRREQPVPADARRAEGASTKAAAPAPAASVPAPAASTPAPSAKQAPAARLSHPGRVIDATSGTTKQQLADYLAAVAPQLLAELRGRPVALLRAPRGVGAATFFQKHSAAAAMPGARVLAAELWPGHEPLLELDDAAALQGAAQMNALEFHPWNARSTLLAKPDRMVFDLDPGEGVAWPAIQEGALLVRALLNELGLQSWLKTSGGQGLHLVVPLAARWPHATVKGFSQAVVQHLARNIGQRFVAKSGPANRRGRIFVDYLRNGEGATTVAAWSPRARPGLGVSMPLVWEELERVPGAAHWTVADAASRLHGPHIAAWAELAACRQSLREPMQALGFKPAPP